VEADLGPPGTPGLRRPVGPNHVLRIREGFFGRRWGDLIEIDSEPHGLWVRVRVLLGFFAWISEFY